MVAVVDFRATAVATVAKLATGSLNQIYRSMVAKFAYLSVIPQDSFTMEDRQM